MIAGAGQGRHVEGEVYAVDRSGLAWMDRLERVDRPDGYQRQRIRVDPVDGPPSEACEALVYLKAPQDVDDPRSEALAAYTPDHAGLYRSRTINRSSGENTDDIEKS
jgi:gamma-glutamylcyclotransferase (GGCT)/AIG2-like uncharacterized protein YtfP